MNNQSIQDLTVAEIVANDYRTAEVFKKHGIDFKRNKFKKITKNRIID